MVKVARREMMLGGVFAALGASCYLLRPKRAFARLSDDALNRAIPARIGEYTYDKSGDFILPPDDQLSEKLYDKVVTRAYIAPGLPPIMALFAYGSTQNLTLQLHRPDECYPPQGFTITPLQEVPVQVAGRTLPANLLTAERPGRVEQVLFWSRIGDQFPGDRTQETLLVARENFRGWMPDGILVRLSVIGTDRTAALRQMQAFATEMGSALPPLGERIVMGQKAVA